MLAATRGLGNLAPNLEVLSCKSNSPQCFCSLLAPRVWCELNICEHILICLGPRFILGLLELFWPLLHGGGLAYFVPTVNQILHKFFSPWVRQNMEKSSDLPWTKVCIGSFGSMLATAATGGPW